MHTYRQSGASKNVCQGAMTQPKHSAGKGGTQVEGQTRGRALAEHPSARK